MFRHLFFVQFGADAGSIRRLDVPISDSTHAVHDLSRPGDEEVIKTLPIRKLEMLAFMWPLIAVLSGLWA